MSLNGWLKGSHPISVGPFLHSMLGWKTTEKEGEMSNYMENSTYGRCGASNIDEPPVGNMVIRHQEASKQISFLGPQPERERIWGCSSMGVPHRKGTWKTWAVQTSGAPSPPNSILERGAGESPRLCLGCPSTSSWLVG